MGDLKKEKETKSHAVAQRILFFYREKIDWIRQYCLHPDKYKTALAISLAICIGITPLFGFTFILVTVFGFVFRLNQIIMQSVHLLVSPLQVLLFYPFMSAGKWAFGLQGMAVVNAEQLPDYIYHHSGEFIHHYLKVFLAGTAIWILFSVASGYCIYKVIMWRIGGYK